MIVTDLPGPVYPDLADPYHGERPCCFSHDGRHVATGSEDGFLQIWDLTGAQVFNISIVVRCLIKSGIIFSTSNVPYFVVTQQ